MPDSTQVSILRAGVQGWNAWRERNPSVHINLTRFEAPEINLARANLKLADLTGSDLTKANLSRADLAGADLTDVNLAGASVDEADCSQAKFRHANLTDATLHGARLAGSDMRHASLKYAKLNGAALQNARLYRADLKGANLVGAHLAGADLGAVNAVEAVFTVANLQNAKCIDGYFNKSVMTSARLTGADFTGANLSNVGLRKADLRGATLVRANLYQANLADANFSKAVMTDADLLQADAGEADFSGAKLVRVNLSEADLRMANLQSATLDYSRLHNARLWETLRAGWSIRNCVCDSVFWDQLATQPTRYGPGEFAKLHAENSVIELVYEKGITTFEINTLPLILHRLATQHPDSHFRLRSIAESPGATKVAIVVESGDPELLKADALKLQEYQMQARLSEEHTTRVERLMSTMMSEFFGAIPKIVEAAKVKQVNFNAPVGAYLEGGTQNQVTVDQTVNDMSAVRDIVSELLDNRATLTMPPDESRKLDEVLVGLQEQLVKPTEKSKYQELMHSLRAILEHTAAVVVAHGKLPEWLPGIIDKVNSAIQALQ